MKIPDIDLDFRDRGEIVSLFPNATRASQMTHDGTRFTKHETGMYFQNIPSDPDTKLAAFDYKIAEEFGYMKIDFLSNRVYEGLTPEDIDAFLEIETDWSWYLDERFYTEVPDTPSLVHLGGYYDLVRKYPPESLTDVAMLIALIRPAKKDLVGKDKDYVLSKIWEKSEKGYSFKKSHSFGYGLMVTLHAKIIAGELGL